MDTQIVAFVGARMWRKSGFLGLLPESAGGRFARDYAANKLLDRTDGWQKAYADDIATIHVRKPDAVHTMEPAVDPKAK